MRTGTTVSALTVLGVIGLGATGYAEALNNLSPPAGVSLPDSVSVRDSVSVSMPDPRVLVVKAIDPWGRSWNEEALLQLDIPYAAVRPERGAIDLDLSLIKVVVVASDQTEELYDALASHRGRLADFVKAGGVLVAHGFCTGWGGGDWADTPWIPRLSAWTREPTQRLTIARLTHPVVANITDGELDNWNFSSVGYFPTLPRATKTIIAYETDRTGKPSYVEFPIGYGRVLATLMPMEWCGEAAHLNEPRFAMLKDELAYAMSRAKIREVMWAGRSGYLNDGVAPNRGKPGDTRFTFKVKVVDPGGAEPSRVQLVLKRDGKTHARLRMAGEATSTRRGRIYSKRLKLPVGNYEYCFLVRFAQGTDPAPGGPARYHFGPRMPSPPYLAWWQGKGYRKDGVHPNTGSSTQDFTFRAVYRDYEGDPPGPNGVKVRLWQDGAAYGPARPLERVGTSGSTYYGILYERKLNLPPGEYEHQVLASDDDGRAGGPASVKTGGLTVTGDAPAVLTALAAVPTRGGAQVTFAVSADAAVTARVLNIAGRPLASLCRDRECKAGTNVLLWDALSDAGLRIPNGTYLVELRARAPDGLDSRRMTQLGLHR